MKLSRRSFLSSLGGAGILAAGGGSTLAFGLEDTTEKLEVQRSTLPISPELNALDGLKIGALSDIHYGPCATRSLHRRALKALQNEGIDLLILLGDYIWLPDSPLSLRFEKVRNPEIESLPEKLKAVAIYEEFSRDVSEFIPRLGCFAIFGNHDNWVDPLACKSAFAKAGIEILNNQSSALRLQDSELVLHGLDDYWTGRPTFSHLPQTGRPKEFHTLLSHNPDLLSLLERESPFNFELALAGHTHGGQIKFPLIGAPKYNIQDSRFNEGLQKQSRFPVYTTRGIGVVEIPYRFNCCPEATVIELKAV